ncbi:MAG TPA: adenylate/guanylate cyclase domain-containing protein [Stellaceae bacterium]|nr:adenylate/guanylate cyclase domain-containing protein [Stellaceae bacterium]
MRPCPSCSTMNPEHAGFCGGCGARLNFVCSKCGASNFPLARFCTACGAQLGAATKPPASPQDAPTSLRDHSSDSTIALSSEGERKEVSILFADISGSLGLIVDRDPEAADAILSEIIDQMAGAVHRYGGTVNKMRGDGIMALFGAPLAQEDHASRACCAAVAMRDLKHDRLRMISGEFDIAVKTRIGINSGEAVIRKMNTDFSLGYDAVGDVVHLASRMEQSAEPGTIRITGATLRLVEGLVQAKSLGKQSVKGMTRQVAIYELTGIASPPSSTRPEGRRALTPFVNRKTEFEILHQSLTEAAAGRGQVVAIVGDAGLGKSRLITEFINSPRATAWRVLRATSCSYDSLTSYLPFVRIFQRLFSIEPNDPEDSVRAKVRDQLTELNADFDRIYPAFCDLLGAQPENDSWQLLDPQMRRQHLVAAIPSLLLSMCRVQPLIVIVEDLHWVDTETQSVIDQLVEGLPRVPILCIVSYRPEYRDEWSGKSYYRHIRLVELHEEAAAELLKSLIGTDAKLSQLQQILLDHTEANPFFLEERVYSLVDDHALVGTRGAYQLAGPVGALRIPGTVRAVLSARIDRLRPRDKQVLQSASVIGETISLPILRLVEDLPEPDLRDAINSLRRSEFLYEAQHSPEVEYCFRHALTHDVAYGSMLREHRRGIHAKVVGALETHLGQRADEFAERLVNHALEGQRWDKAVRYGRMAGGKAAWRSSNQESVSFYEQALQGLQHLAQDVGVQTRGVDVRFDLRNPLFQLGKLDAVVDHLNIARDLAEQIADQPRLARALMYLSHVSWLMGDQKASLAYGERAVVIAESLRDDERKVRTRFHLGLSHLARCDFRKTVEILQATVVACRNSALSGPLGPLLSMALAYLVRALAELGDFGEASELAAECVRIADAEMRPFSRIIAYLSAGYVRDRKGETAEAIPSLERALELSRSTEARLMTPIAAGFLGAAYANSQRSTEAITLLKEAIETAAEMRLGLYQAPRMAHLGLAYLNVGDYVSAKENAEMAEALALKQGELGARAAALSLMGEIAVRARPFDLTYARDRFTRALHLAEELEMRPLVAHCHRSLGLLAIKMNEPQEGNAALETASALYTELGMSRAS